MRNIAFAATGILLAALAIAVTALVALDLPGTASAQNPSPPPGIHQACQRMNEKGMEGMHAGMMNAGGQMGEWIAAGEPCPH